MVYKRAKNMSHSEFFHKKDLGEVKYLKIRDLRSLDDLGEVACAGVSTWTCDRSTGVQRQVIFRIPLFERAGSSLRSE